MKPSRVVAGSRSLLGFGMLLVLLAAAGAQSSHPVPAGKSREAWKEAGADSGLRQAFERAVYAFPPSMGGAYKGENRAQQLKMEFTAQQARFWPSGNNAAFVLRLNGYGRAKHLQRPDARMLVAHGARLEYRSRGITEWYVNDQRGVEQGFTVSQKPGSASAPGPLVIELEVSGGLQPVLVGNAIELRRDGRAMLRYSGLRAWDAVGRSLDAQMTARAGRIQLQVDDNAAQYPITVDPWIQHQKLTANDSVGGDDFGYSVSVDGDTAVIGASQQGGQGAAYVFTRSNGTWTQQQKLTASDPQSFDDFGFSVSVSGDTAVIGAPDNGYYIGAAYVFTRSNGTWTLQQKLIGDLLSYSNFGISVSVEGDTALIGAYGENAAFVYTRSNGTWTLQQTLTADDAASGDQFGFSVSLSGDTALIGAHYKNTFRGEAYVFTRSSGTWTQQSKLTAGDAADYDQFGDPVSVSGDTALVAAHGKNSGQGAAYVFTLSNGTWTPQQKLTASDGAGGDNFGYSVSVGGDTALIGANCLNICAGGAYLFTRSNGTWTEQQKLIASDGAFGDYFGSSVAVQGATALIGAASNTGSRGAVYVFGPPPDSSTTTTISSSLNPSFTTAPNASVVFTATVTSGSGVVNTGTVTFKDGANTIPGCSAQPVSNGTTTCTTSFSTEGVHLVSANYNGGPGFLPSNGSLSQEVNNHTVVNGNQYCNPGTISLPSAAGGTGSPYSSNIFVSGAGTSITNISLLANGVTNATPSNMHIMLVSPAGTPYVLWSNAGGNTAASNVNVTLVDGSPFIPSPLVTGTYQPTAFGPAVFPAPAPGSPQYAGTFGTSTFASEFNGTNPNGKWKLFLYSDSGSGASAGVNGGWCLNVQTTPADLSISKTHAPSSFSQGESGDQFTITVKNNGPIATNGTVTVTDNLPAGLTATAASGSNWSCTVGNPTTTCTSSQVVTPGNNYPDITLTVNVGATATNPQQNTATVSGSGDNTLGDNTAQDSVPILQAPKTITISGGDMQITNVNTAFASPLSVKVTDATGAGIPNYPVTFTAPSSGASGTFSNATNTITVFTNNSGVANSGTFTANGTSGTYAVSASAGTALANFQLTNNTPPVAVAHDVTVDADASCTAAASINNGSYDPDPSDHITLTQTPRGPYHVGTTAVTLTVTDDHGASSQATANVTVRRFNRINVNASTTQSGRKVTIKLTATVNSSCGADGYSGTVTFNYSGTVTGSTTVPVSSSGSASFTLPTITGSVNETYSATYNGSATDESASSGTKSVQMN